MKFPILDQRKLVSGNIIAGILTIAAIFLELYSGVFSSISNPAYLLLLLLLFGLFAEKPEGLELRYVILLFVVGTGLFVVAERTGKPLGEISFGDALGPRLGQVPVLSGLLWLIPVVFSFSLTRKTTENIYLRALLGAVLVTVPAIFLSFNAPYLDFIHWENILPTAGSFLVWFIGGFLLHFAGIQMQVKLENPMAMTLYLCWISFQAILFLVPFLMR